MRIEATIEEWRALYDVAIKLKELKPWEQLWDMDLITIMEIGKKEPCICSVMGRSGECYAIAAYDGLKSIKGFFETAYNNKIPGHQLIRYQNNIMCNYGNRDELTTKERNIIKELGLKFRGKNNWIYFRTFESGYIPYMPNKDEVIAFTKMLKHVSMAIEELNNGISIDFQNGNTLMRKFDARNNQWINLEEPLIIPDMDYSVPEISDELLISRLRKQKQNNSILELDIAYLNSTINDRGYDKPLIPRLCMLVDGINGFILSQEMIKPDDNDIDILFNTVINYVIQRGRPKNILVRDAYIASIVIDLCEKINIEIIESPKLNAIDEFIESFYNFGL
ncbi:DUF7309 domain-containing protein [Clostridium sp. UBA4395]|uniref:DUF7309 domain-containing protein n=1 Tax=Clostridium sp. UBA4395 TaxID=1946360 RepID=UPI0032180478